MRSDSMTFNTFMNNLWDCKDVFVPKLGEIVSTRVKYGTDIQVMCEDTSGEITLIDGTELYERYPNLFA